VGEKEKISQASVLFDFFALALLWITVNRMEASVLTALREL
jgi:hypothetical protein